MGAGLRAVRQGAREVLSEGGEVYSLPEAEEKTGSGYYGYKGTPCRPDLDWFAIEPFAMGNYSHERPPIPQDRTATPKEPSTRSARRNPGASTPSNYPSSHAAFKRWPLMTPAVCSNSQTLRPAGYPSTTAHWGENHTLRLTQGATVRPGDRPTLRQLFKPLNAIQVLEFNGSNAECGGADERQCPRPGAALVSPSFLRPYTHPIQRTLRSPFGFVCKASMFRLASSISSPVPYLATVCHFSNTRRSNTSLSSSDRRFAICLLSKSCRMKKPSKEVALEHITYGVPVPVQPARSTMTRSIVLPCERDLLCDNIK